MKVLLTFLLLTTSKLLWAIHLDSLKSPLRIWGNIKSTHILYNPSINPFVYYPKVSNQTYSDIFLQKNKLHAGIRLESYLEPQVGMPNEMKGWGLASKYVQFKTHKLDLGIGNRYEQFGSGLIFKTQEQRALGMDNALDGLWANVNAGKMQVKSLVGKQRMGFRHAAGWLAGLDLEIRKKYPSGSAFVGLGNMLKIENYEGPAPQIENKVLATSIRTGFQDDQVSFYLEFATKSKDPNENNFFNAKPAHAFVGVVEWTGLKNTLVLNLKGVENMDFRSERGTKQNIAIINYVPNYTKIHTYRLLTLYPYATQTTGEVGGQLEWTYFAENGGEITNNLSWYDQPGHFENRQSLYREWCLEYSASISQNAKINLLANYTHFNKGIILGGFPETVKYQALVADFTFMANKNLQINTQAQHLYTKQDKGSWAMGLLDLRIKSRWSLFIMDEFNYSQTNHYPQAGTALHLGNKNIGVSYGKVREGLFCVGGVCQIIPEYEGLSVNFGINF